MKASARRGLGRRRARRRRGTTARVRGLQPAGPPLFFLIFSQGVRQVIDATLREFVPAGASASESESWRAWARCPGASFVGGRGQHAARLRALLRALARSVTRFAPVLHPRHERFLCTGPGGAAPAVAWLRAERAGRFPGRAGRARPAAAVCRAWLRLELGFLLPRARPVRDRHPLSAGRGAPDSEAARAG